MSKNKPEDTKAWPPTKTSEDNWQHRSAGMLCQTCMYYAQKITPEVVAKTVGRCRRNAPTMNGWPVMFPTDWCGAHKLDETKI